MKRHQEANRAMLPGGNGLTRRQLLGAGGTSLAVAALLGGGLSPALAAGKTIYALVPPSPIQPKLRDLIQARTGIEIQIAPYTSPTDSMAKLLAPGGGSRYDVMITLTDFVRPALSDALGRDMLLPLDPVKVPNLKHVIPLFKGDILEKRGQSYTAPFYWGYDSVVYNRDEVPEDDALTQSWGVLFDDKYKGRVALRDNAHQSLLLTALYLGHKDPLKMEKSDLDELVKFLISKKGNFRALWTQFAQAVNLMSSKEVVAMYGWILMRTTLQNQGFNVTNNWPKEGLLWWGQAAFVPKEAKSPDAALEFINFLLSAEYGHALTEETGGILSASTIARAKFSEDERRKLGYDIMERGLNLFRLGLPERLDLWLEAWARFKSA